MKQWHEMTLTELADAWHTFNPALREHILKILDTYGLRELTTKEDE